jgi:lipoic acid synthetase
LTAGVAVPWDPAKIDDCARAVASAGLTRVALLSVTRDDLADGGSSRLTELVRRLRQLAPATAVELHVGDLRGPLNAWRDALRARPDLVHHWVAAAPRLYVKHFEGADYVRSLEILRVAREEFDKIRTRATLLTGLGESKDELVAALADLKSVRADEVLLTDAPPPLRATPPTAEVLEKVLTVGRRLGFARLERIEHPRSCAPPGDLDIRRSP